MIVLDTNVLSEPLNPQPSRVVIAWLRSPDLEFAISAISVAELLSGVRRLPPGSRRDTLLRRIEGTLDLYEGSILPFDHSAARAFAALDARSRARGHTITREDGMIAAICLSAGCSLATRNIRDFTGTGVDLIDPWRPRGSLDE